MARLNFTDRKRITRDFVAIDLREVDQGLELDAAVHDLSPLALPADASVFVELQRRVQSVRHSLGTVANPTRITSQLIEEFDSPVGIVMRVIVVASDGSGRLLAVADKLKPATGNGEDGRSPLLVFRGSSTMGEEVWRLDLSNDIPVVEVNNAVGDWNAFARSSTFVAVVYPEVLRQITIWAIGLGVPDDDDAPNSAWARFIETLGLPTSAWPMVGDDEDDTADLVNEVVATFCRRHKFASQIAGSADQ